MNYTYIELDNDLENAAYSVQLEKFPPDLLYGYLAQWIYAVVFLPSSVRLYIVMTS